MTCSPGRGRGRCPLWLPLPEYAGFGSRSDARAVGLGLERRPLEATLRRRAGRRAGARAGPSASRRADPGRGASISSHRLGNPKLLWYGRRRGSERRADRAGPGGGGVGDPRASPTSIGPSGSGSPSSGLRPGQPVTVVQRGVGGARVVSVADSRIALDARTAGAHPGDRGGRGVSGTVPSCHSGGGGVAAPAGTPVVALAGAPNVGKSTLFNRLTGARRDVGNWPGTTVEVGRGLMDDGVHRFDVIDLPGAYSLDPLSPDEALTRALLVDVEPQRAPGARGGDRRRRAALAVAVPRPPAARDRPADGGRADDGRHRRAAGRQCRRRCPRRLPRRARRPHRPAAPSGPHRTAGRPGPCPRRTGADRVAAAGGHGGVRPGRRAVHLDRRGGVRRRPPHRPAPGALVGPLRPGRAVVGVGAAALPGRDVGRVPAHHDGGRSAAGGAGLVLQRAGDDRGGGGARPPSASRTPGCAASSSTG